MASILRKLCEERGLSFFVEPEYGYVGYITLPSGAKSCFTGSSLAINSESAVKIASDKDYTARFLKRAALNVPEGILLFAPSYRRDIIAKHPELASRFPDWAQISAFADDVGYPLFLKPNHGASGQDVYRIKSPEELQSTLRRLFRKHTKLLLQPAIAGRDLRILILDGQIVSAYERIPLNIIGNGTDTIAALLKAKIEHLKKHGRASGLKVTNKSIARHLESQGCAAEEVVENGKRIYLLPNANLSTGGDAVEILETLSPDFKQVCSAAASTIGLRFAGVDVLCDDPSANQPVYTILELNSAPGMRNYASLGPVQRARTVAIYRSIIDLLAAE